MRQIHVHTRLLLPVMCIVGNFARICFMNQQLLRPCRQLLWLFRLRIVSDSSQILNRTEVRKTGGHGL